VTAKAQLQGANLEGAKLQGARLEGARLEGSDLAGTGISDEWVTPAPDIDLIERDECDSGQKLPSVPHHPPENLRGAESKGEVWERKLAEFLADLACSGPGPYVARGLLGNGRIRATGAQETTVSNELRKGKSDPTACPGVIGFNDQDWAELYGVDRSVPKPAQDAK
jgi:uncharacterized protein YjbI with pentapeptide repeats